MKKLVLIILSLFFCSQVCALNNFPAISSGNYLGAVGIKTQSTSKKYFFDVINTQTISGQFSTATGETITVYWGDGTSNSYSGINQAWSHDYGFATTKTVKIKNKNSVTKFTMTQSGANISFDLANLPSSLTVLYIAGENTVTGSLSDLPSSLVDFYCLGSTNTITGPLSGLPSSLVTFYCFGQNTITGSLSDLPSSLVTFSCLGQNAITGSLSGLPSGVIYFNCAGKNTIDTYTTKVWAANLEYIRLIPVSPGGLDSSEIDQLLIDLAATTWTGAKVITLAGTNAARTSASDAAVATLTGLNVTVTTNP